MEAIYPVVWVGGFVVKVYHGKHVVEKSIQVGLGANLKGEKEVLGLWLAETEGAKFWLGCATELKQRGIQDIFTARMDGLKGLPLAVTAIFPKTLAQLCIGHLVRASLRHVMATDSRAIVAMLKQIYQSASPDEAQAELEVLA